MPTLCAVTVRRIKPGSFEQFRKVWEPEPWYPNLRRAVLMRHEDDENQVLSVGYFEASEDDIEAMRDDPSFMSREEQRVRRIAEFEDSVLLNGIYELVEEVRPPAER